ncbi:MAG TPA: family 78 glycoside hydrolase catalytic domain [Tepidisphaeraceae bacterium]
MTMLTLFHAQALALTPGSLRCEYRDNPSGVDVARPRLSWILASEQRGASQKAYRILVASSPEKLARDTGDLWDSGDTASADMSQIAYAGKELASNQIVYWKVRATDQTGKAFAWSEPATWTMGIMNEADWRNAKWIGAPDANEPFDPKGAKGPKAKYESVLLRRALEVKPGLKRAVVNVCGLAQYEMTLNGEKVGDAYLTPGWTAYDKTCLYDSYDVTASLKPGVNAVGLMLGNGFYNTHHGRYTKVRGSYGPLQAIGLIRLEYSDGSIEHVVTDASWKTSSGPVVFSSIFGGEDFDARLVQEGWDHPGFDDAQWETPAITKGPGGVLKGLTAAAPPIRVMAVLKPVGRKQLSPNVAVYDLGQNASVVALIQVKGPAGSTVKVTPSELVHANGDINERMTNNNSHCTYTLSGRGEETYQWKFYYRGGQFLRVETKEGPGGGGLPEVTRVEGHVIRADAPQAGEFSASNDKLNKIHSLIRWAQMSNMMSVMTDCPHREKLGWLEQIQLNGPALRYNFDMSGVFQKMVNDMYDAQRANGLVPSLVPNYYKWDEGKFTTPIQWGSACILVPWQQYQFAGDTRVLESNYEGMKRYVGYIEKRAKDHIVGFGLGDWYDNLGEGDPTLTPVALTDTAFHYQNYRIMARVAAVLNKPEEAAAFESRAEEVRNAFNTRFYDAATGNYAKGSQGANCLPLSMNIAEPANRPAILKNLIADLQAKQTTTGEVSFGYMLRALADSGRSDLIYTTYTSDTNGYGLQVKLGKTTLTEAWNGGNSSQNHFMFGQINEWYYRDLAGIQNAKDDVGFRQIVIKPSPVGDLTWVKASYQSARGRIASDWMNDATGLTMRVTIPVGATATVHVPAASAELVKEGGAAAASAPGVKFVRMEDGAAVYAVGSGTYSFSSRIAAVTPARLTAVAQSGKVGLTWEPSANAAHYTVRRTTVLDGSTTTLAQNVTDMTFTDATVSNGTTYLYGVTASNELGAGGPAEAIATPTLIDNAGFELPLISGFVSNPNEAGWTFAEANNRNGSGLTRNGSAYTNRNRDKILEGQQAAYLQGTGSISQRVDGLQAGATYELTFAAAQRVSTNQGGQTWDVQLDGKTIGAFSPEQTAVSYTDYTVTFKASAGSHVLSFVGTNTRGGDNTVFLDNVRIARK